MSDLIHNFGARKHKRGVSFEWTTDVSLEVIGEVDQHSVGGGSEEQAIVVMDSQDMGFHGQLAVETAHLAYLEEVPLTHEEARGGWGGVPFEQIDNQPTKAMSSRAGRCRSLLPDRLLLYSYIPP